MSQHIFDDRIIFDSGTVWELEEMIDQAIETLLWTGIACVSEDEILSLSEVPNLDAAMRDQGFSIHVYENLRESMRFMLSDLSDDEMEECGRIMSATQFAHDYVLTAQRHGAGFWDRGYGAIGDKLTELAHDWADAAGTLSVWWEIDQEDGSRSVGYTIGE